MYPILARLGLFFGTISLAFGQYVTHGVGYGLSSLGISLIIWMVFETLLSVGTKHSED
jgi:hypothetical protein